MKTVSPKSSPDPNKRPGATPTKKSNSPSDEASQKPALDTGTTEPKPIPAEEHRVPVTNADEQHKITNAEQDALEENE
jgi:hypothetical protein